MGRLSRCFLRSGLACLLLGLGLGVAGPLFPAASGWPAALWPVQLHLITVGWLTQLIFGVAWWLFPRASTGPARGRESVGWIAFWCLQAGLLLRIIFEPLRLTGQLPPPGPILLAAAAGLHLAAALAFAIAIWPRVRGRN